MPNVGKIATLSVCPVLSLTAFKDAFLIALRAPLISLAYIFPTSVNTMVFFIRLNNDMPSCSSKALTCLLIAPCVRFSSCAAKVKLPFLADASKAINMLVLGMSRLWPNIIYPFITKNHELVINFDLFMRLYFCNLREISIVSNMLK